MQDALILSGTHKGKDFSGIKCKLMGAIKYGARGWYGNFQIPGHGVIRIQLPDENSVQIDKINLVDSKEQEDTEDSIIKRIEERFEIFKYSIGGIADASIRSLIVAGAPGIGKTESIVRELDDKKLSLGIEYQVVRGNIVSSYQLYQLLYDNLHEDSILVLDDCDAILNDANGLNILKAALDSGDRPRVISYKSQSVMNLGLPQEFEFNGRMIFVTNENFQRVIDKDNSVKSKHLKALVDRSLYLDLMLHSRREVYCRIKQMVHYHGLLDTQEIHKKYFDHILLWIKDNMDQIRSLSLRTPIHIAEMIRTNPDNWQRMANVFLLRQGR